MPRARKKAQPAVSRRDFLASAALAGASLILPGRTRAAPASAGAAKGSAGDIKVGLIGGGSQGRTLLVAAVKIPGVKFAAVADIWPYHSRYAANILKEYGHPAAVYEDYREMLAKASLDAVLIATPDWVHAEQTIAALRAGVHVYCEKEMANTVGDARAMVKAAAETGKLLQIGHQRRSNPRYRHAESLVNGEGVLGRITHVYGQWNRPKPLEQGWPKGSDLDAAALARWGYGSMEQLRNWRWYRKYASGPIGDLGSHQLDVFNWFLRVPPVSVLAAGGADVQPEHEWGDYTMGIYEWRPPTGPVRGYYQVLSSTSHGGYYEVLMGEGGSLEISEDPKVGFFYREPQAQRRQWEDEASRVSKMGRDAIELKIGETRKEAKRSRRAIEAEADARKPLHQPHLENFFDAIRGKVALTCPASEAFATAVTALRTNDAVAASTPLALAPAEFVP
ncbi:MAG: Gfo/Idh/MocA family oxidoreductase [Candidatus Coatesbacteria bacterium]